MYFTIVNCISTLRSLMHLKLISLSCARKINHKYHEKINCARFVNGLGCYTHIARQ